MAIDTGAAKTSSDTNFGNNENVIVDIDKIEYVYPFPNPFTGETTFEFYIPDRAYVTLKIFDLSGRRITTLFDGIAEGNRKYQEVFESNGLPEGVYLYQFEAGGGNYQMGKLVILK